MSAQQQSGEADALVAINVCIIPPRRITDVSLAACNALCEPLKGTPNYYVLANVSSEALAAGASATPQHGIPHCTLYQLFAKKSDVPKLGAEVRSIVAAVLAKTEKDENQQSASHVLTCEGTLAPGPVFGRTDAGEDVHVPSVVITNEGVVKALHEAVVNGLRPFHCGPSSASDAGDQRPLTFYQSTFNAEWPASESSANWTLNFEQNAAFGKYFPHITLGSCVGKPEGARLMLPPAGDAAGGQPVTFTIAESAIVISEMANNCCCYKVLEVV